MQHIQIRTSESTDHWQLYDSGAPLEPEVRDRICRANFGFWRLDDAEVTCRLPAGSAGQAAIFTDRIKASHVIRKVLLRQIAIVNYINLF